MKAPAFGYQRPETVAAALDAFAAADGDASYIAGGQSLVPALALRLQSPAMLIDISRIEDLRGVRMEAGHLRIGALTRHAEALTDPLIAQHAPLLLRRRHMSPTRPSATAARSAAASPWPTRRRNSRR